MCRLKLSRNHYCSLTCLSKFTVKQRSEKLSIRHYPMKCGVCKNCSGDIIAKYSAMYKVNRKFCSKKCKASFQNKGRKKTKYQIKVARENLKRLWSNGLMRKLVGSPEWRKKVAEANLGNKSHFWKGGLVDKNRRERNSWKTKYWREQVFKRDNYTCVQCGSRNGNGKAITLNADHIKSWSKYPKLRFDINNGRTLCLDCHIKTDNFAYKAIYQI